MVVSLKGPLFFGQIKWHFYFFTSTHFKDLPCFKIFDCSFFWAKMRNFFVCENGYHISKSLQITCITFQRTGFTFQKTSVTFQIYRQLTFCIRKRRNSKRSITLQKNIYHILKNGFTFQKTGITTPKTVITF